jgi:hypothetical protein
MSDEMSPIFNSDRADLLRNFQQRLLENQDLQAMIRWETEEDVVRVAESFGFPINTQDIKRLQGGPWVAMSQTELEATLVVEAPCWCDPSVVDTKSCG